MSFLSAIRYASKFFSSKLINNIVYLFPVNVIILYEIRSVYFPDLICVTIITDFERMFKFPTDFPSPERFVRSQKTYPSHNPKNPGK